MVNKKFNFRGNIDTLTEANAFLSILYQQIINNNKSDNFIFIRASKREGQNDKHWNLPGNSNINKLAQTASLASSNEKLSWHVVINGYGQGTTKTDKEGNQLIKTGRIIQFEADDERSLDEKLDDWQILGMPKPTLQVWTGNKSIHNYWVLGEDVDILSLHEFQVQLTRKGKDLGADGWDQPDTSWGSTAVKTMRMPGFSHPKTGNKAQLIDIPENPIYYSLDALWSAIASPGYELRGNWNKNTKQFDKWISLEDRQDNERIEKEKAAQRRLEQLQNAKHLSAISLVDRPQLDPDGLSLSLLEMISRTNLGYFHKGSVSGDKNDEGIALANDLIGCQNWAIERGAKLVASAEELFIDYCRRSSLSDHEGMGRFRSAAKSNKRPANKNLDELTLTQWLDLKDGNGTSKPSLLGWDLLKIANQLIEISKLKDEEVKLNFLRKWLEEDLEKNTSTGWIGVGNLVQIKSDMIEGKINLITSANKTNEETGFFTSNFEYCHTIDFKRVAPLFSWYLENTSASRDLTRHLYIAGAGNKVFLLDNNYCKWGAGYYFAKKDQQLTPDLSLNRRYLKDEDDPIIIPLGTKILAIKSEMGTGKTTWLADVIVKSHLRPLAIYSRVTLTQDVAEKFGITFYKETAGDAAQHKKYLSSGAALCINSLKANGYINFNVDDWGLPKGRDILVLDEIESTLETLCTSATIKHNRGEIQNNFIKLIKNILHPDSKSMLVISDANLKQSTVDLMRTWAGYDAPQFVIENSWKFEKGSRVVNFYKKVPDFLGQMVKQLKDTEERLFITSDTREAKGENSVLSTETIAAVADLFKIPNLVIDQGSQHQTDHHSYGMGANSPLIINEIHLRESAAFRNGVVITSPTLNAGVSFDIDNGSDFTSVWGCFKGVVNLEGLQQQIERERRNIERNLYVTETGKPNGCSPLTSELSLKDDDFLSQLLNTKGITSTLVQLEKGYGFDEAEIISEKMLIDEDLALAVWRRKNAIESSFASRNLRVNLMAQLAERGYWVNEIESSEDLLTEKKNKEETVNYSEIIGTSSAVIDQMVKNYNEENYQELGKESLQLFQATAMKLREDKLKAIVTSDPGIVTTDLLRRSDRTKAEHEAVTKHHYENWAKGVECTVDTFEAWEKNKKVVETGFINYCHLTGSENGRLKAIKEDSFQSSSGKRSKRDVNSSFAKVKLLANNIRLAEFIAWAEKSGVYCSSDHAVVAFNADLMEYSKEIKILLGVNISVNSEKAITNAGNILRACGRNQEKVKQSGIGEDGKRVRFYCLTETENIYSQFWAAWSTDAVKDQTLSEISSATSALDRSLEKTAQEVMENGKALV
jgi:hypothetical protein